MFPTRVGTPMRGDTLLNRYMKPLARRFGDPSLNFQKLRRSYSSFYPLLNIHPQVARIGMGHGSIDTTMRHYTAVPPELLRQAADALGGPLFGGENGATPVAFPSNPDELAALRVELEGKLLEIQELEGRARQDSNLRPPDS